MELVKNPIGRGVNFFHFDIKGSVFQVYSLFRSPEGGHFHDEFMEALVIYRRGDSDIRPHGMDSPPIRGQQPPLFIHKRQPAFCPIGFYISDRQDAVIAFEMVMLIQRMGRNPQKSRRHHQQGIAGLGNRFA